MCIDSERKTNTYQVMKANEVPEKIYLTKLMLFAAPTINSSNNDIEYIRKDSFIEKAKEWFEMQPERYDANGVRCYGLEDFEDFKNYLKYGKV